MLPCLRARLRQSQCYLRPTLDPFHRSTWASASRDPSDPSNPRHSSDNNNNSNRDDETSRDSEAELRMGKAIDTLRQELPHFFSLGLQDYSIYDEDVHLTEYTHYHFYIRGRWMYRFFLTTTRHILSLYFTNLQLHVKSMTPSPTDDKHLVVRWSLEGSSRVHRLLSLLSPLGVFRDDDGHSSGSDQRVMYEGLFVYKFNRQGWISEHQVSHVEPAPRQFAPLTAIGWWQRQQHLSLAE